MTTDNIIDLLIIACNLLLVWSIAATLTIWSERKELTKLHKSKEELRENLTKHNYSLCQDIERLKREKHAQRKKLTAEIHALRTQLHQLRTKYKRL
jgi:hypothetical protein